VVVESVHEVGQVGGGELPLEGFRGLVVTCFEGGEPFDEDVEIIEVIGGIGLSVERWRRRSPLTRTYFGLGGRKCL